MRIEYDAEADALYVQFKDVRPDDNVDVEEGVTVDLDDEGTYSRARDSWTQPRGLDWSL